MHEELNLNSILFILVRRWFWILLCTIVGLVAFLLYSIHMVTPQYTSSTELYVRNALPTSVAGDGTIKGADLTAAQRLVETYIVVLQNPEVEAQVASEMGNKITVEQLHQYISMSAVEETEVLRVTALTENPELSAEICNAVAKVAPTVLRKVVQAGTVEIISVAKPAGAPSTPNIPRNSMLGALLGFAFALAVLFLIFILDNTIKGEEDLQRRTDIPILGEIPSLGDHSERKNNPGKRQQKLAHRTHVVESYKMVRANLLFSMTEAKNNIIAITSAEPNAGKSTTSANISISMALTGVKVLIVDGDMRRPTLHKFFKIENTAGLSELLSRPVQFEDLVHRGVHLSNLDVLTSGQNPPNPSELLGTARMSYFMEKWAKEYDYVFIDTPPINVVADSLTLANRAAGLLLIARQKQTHYDQLNKAAESITNLDAKVLGIVISDVNWKQKPYYYGRYRYSNYNYKYQSYYYSDPDSGSSAPALKE